LIWWFCRALAIILIVSGFVYFFLNMDAFDSLAGKANATKSELENIILSGEEDKNATSDELSTLLRARSSLRQEKDEMIDNSIGDREEMNALKRKMASESENLAERNEEIEKQRETLNKLESQIDEEDQRKNQLTEQKDELLKELEEQQSINSQKTSTFDGLNAEVNKMELSRRAAESNFRTTFKSMISELVLPEFLFWGDKLEVMVEGISPSGHGFFIRQGLQEGIRSEFFFLASTEEMAITEPFFVKSTLVEEGYSYIEVEDPGFNCNGILRSGQKLYLIRTGESDSDDTSELEVDMALEVDSF